MKQFLSEFVDDCDEGVRHHYEILETIVDVQTARQKVRIDRLSRFGIFVSLDGWPQVAQFDSDRYHEALVHVPLINRTSVDSPFSACILGGGDFGVVHQLVKYKTCSQIRMVDWDLEFIELAKTHLTCIHHNSWKDSRVSVERENCDVFDFFEKASSQYDVVFGDLTDLTSLGTGVGSFIQKIKKLLYRNGIFVSQASEFPSTPSHVEPFLSMIIEAKKEFKHLWVYRTHVPSFAYEQAFIIGTDNNDYDPLSWSTNNIDEWIAGLNNNVQEYSGRIHHGMFGLPKSILQKI